MNTIETAKQLIRKGYAPIPIPRGSKAPVIKNWNQLSLTENGVDKYFAIDSNIGINLGKPECGSLVDVDLDCIEAIAAARCFLPRTELIHGRISKPESHYWYQTTPPPKPLKFLDTNGQCLLEIRSTNQQTIIPPSIHPSGEKLEWLYSKNPLIQDSEIVVTSAKRTASCALVARHWPTKGSRQEFCLALSGTLLRAGWSSDMTTNFILTAANIANDEEAEKRSSVVSDSVKRLHSNQPVHGIDKLQEFLGKDVISRCCQWLCITSNPADKNEDTTSSDNESQGQLLVNLVSNVEFFHTTEKEAFATYHVNDHSENSSIKGNDFKRWLQHQYFKKHKKVPSSQTFNDAMSVFEARALFEGKTRPTFIRIGNNSDAIYLDLGSDTWDCVQITKDNFRVMRNPPIKFRRTRGMQALPYPAPGDIDELRQFVNIPDEQSWYLVVSWLVAALRPFGPFPILMLQGEQGSAKSTTARVLRELVDPYKPTLRSLPRDERDLMIAANNSHILAFDNLSGISLSSSDILCRLATGGGYATRALFSNEDESLFDAMRPILLNGIDDIATRQDLADRSLIISLPHISDTHRITEREFWHKFREVQPRILGALLKGVSTALMNLDHISLPSLPRMADFVTWATAAETAFGWPKLATYNAYLANQKEMVESGIDAHPISQAIRSLLLKRTSWRGTSTELLQQLRAHIDNDSLTTRNWPKSPAALGSQLRRISPQLRYIGITIEFARENQNCRRVIILTKDNSNAVHAVHAVQTLK